MDLFPLKLTGGAGLGGVGLFVAATIMFVLNILLIAAYVFILAYVATKGYQAA